MNNNNDDAEIITAERIISELRSYLKTQEIYLQDYIDKKRYWEAAKYEEYTKGISRSLNIARNVLSYMLEEKKLSMVESKICPVCNLPVTHCYPYWNKDPHKYKDARPYHEKCWWKWVNEQ